MGPPANAEPGSTWYRAAIMRREDAREKARTSSRRTGSLGLSKSTVAFWRAWNDLVCVCVFTSVVCVRLPLKCMPVVSRVRGYSRVSEWKTDGEIGIWVLAYSSRFEAGCADSPMHPTVSLITQPPSPTHPLSESQARETGGIYPNIALSRARRRRSRATVRVCVCVLCVCVCCAHRRWSRAMVHARVFPPPPLSTVCVQIGHMS